MSGRIGKLQDEIMSQVSLPAFQPVSQISALMWVEWLNSQQQLW